MKVPSSEEIRSCLPDCRIVKVGPCGHCEMYTLGDGLSDIGRFVSQHRVRTVFVEPVYICREDLRITDDHLKGLGLDILGGVQFYSHRFNRDLEYMGLSSPVELRVFVLFEGREFGVLFTDTDLDRLRRITPEVRVAGFAEERRRSVRGNMPLSEKRADPMQEKFADVLVQDPVFRSLRTDRDRFNHVMKVARRPGNDQLLKCVMKEGGNGFSMEKIRSVLSIIEERAGTGDGGPKQMVFDRRCRRASFDQLLDPLLLFPGDLTVHRADEHADQDDILFQFG